MSRTHHFLALCLTFLCCITSSWAEVIDGSWEFDLGVNYEEPNTTSPAPPVKTLQIVDSRLSLSPRCIISIKNRGYYPGGPFQFLLKAGETEANIRKFLHQHFNFSLQEVKIFYQTDSKMNGCNELGEYFIANEERLIAIQAGHHFYSYIRNKQNSWQASAILHELKPSQLPFSIANYMGLCASQITAIKGVPQATSKCAPLYFPHVSSRNSRDALSKIVGAHLYQKGGAENESEDYNNPVSNNLHPVFLVFPPMGDVLLVRVDDMERAEERDPIRGAYISIKGGKVIDQLNESCSFDTTYLCSSGGKQPKYQLLKSGKFSQLM
jgi:hypothetical protein